MLLHEFQLPAQSANSRQFLMHDTAVHLLVVWQADPTNSVPAPLHDLVGPPQQHANHIFVEHLIFGRLLNEYEWKLCPGRLITACAQSGPEK